jgi:hypothetical protein|tara:strand:- start:1525 stop:1746 length:222 start_codon:yes stop_codon:yes gene_type:complete
MFNLFYQNNTYCSKIEHKLCRELFNAYSVICSKEKILKETETKRKEFNTLVHKSVLIQILIVALKYSKLDVKK